MREITSDKINGLIPGREQFKLQAVKRTVAPENLQRNKCGTYPMNNVEVTTFETDSIIL